MLVSTLHNNLFGKKCYVSLGRVNRRKASGLNGEDEVKEKVPKMKEEITSSGGPEDLQPTDLSVSKPPEGLLVKKEHEEKEAASTQSEVPTNKSNNGSSSSSTEDNPQDLSKSKANSDQAVPEDNSRSKNRPKPSHRKKKKVKGHKRSSSGLPAVLDPNFPFNTASRISQELPGCNWLEDKIKSSR